MEQRVSLITLGVEDMNRAAAFYEALGWTRVESPDGVIAFNLIGQTLGLYPKAALWRMSWEWMPSDHRRIFRPDACP